jgi:hypothetical protein
MADLISIYRYAASDGDSPVDSPNLRKAIQLWEEACLIGDVDAMKSLADHLYIGKKQVR